MALYSWAPICNLARELNSIGWVTFPNTRWCFPDKISFTPHLLFFVPKYVVSWSFGQACSALVNGVCPFQGRSFLALLRLTTLPTAIGCQQTSPSQIIQLWQKCSPYFCFSQSWGLCLYLLFYIHPFLFRPFFLVLKICIRPAFPSSSKSVHITKIEKLRLAG